MRRAAQPSIGRASAGLFRAHTAVNPLTQFKANSLSAPALTWHVSGFRIVSFFFFHFLPQFCRGCAEHHVLSTSATWTGEDAYAVTICCLQQAGVHLDVVAVGRGKEGSDVVLLDPVKRLFGVAKGGEEPLCIGRVGRPALLRSQQTFRCAKHVDPCMRRPRLLCVPHAHGAVLEAVVKRTEHK